jgi:hypothetical protein
LTVFFISNNNKKIRAQTNYFIFYNIELENKNKNKNPRTSLSGHQSLAYIAFNIDLWKIMREMEGGGNESFGIGL